MVINDYKKINKDKKNSSIKADADRTFSRSVKKTDGDHILSHSVTIADSVNIKSKIEKINSDWKSALKIIEENIQDIYSEREELYKEKEILLQKLKNNQELTSELVIKISNNQSQLLKNDYIKLSMEAEKISKDIDCIEEQIAQYNQTLSQLIEKNNDLQTEYDKIKQNLNKEYNKFELLEKVNNIEFAVKKLNFDHQQNILNEIKSKNIAINLDYHLEQELRDKSKLEAELLKTSVEKKYLENLKQNVSFEKLFIDSEMKHENTGKNKNKIDQLFK